MNAEIQAALQRLEIRQALAKLPAEHQAGVLRLRIEKDLAELRQMAEAGQPAASTAVRYLASVGIVAAESVRQAAQTNPVATKAFAATVTKWPVVNSLLPGDKKGLDGYLKQIGLGRDSPLKLGEWGFGAPGTRWAFAFWQLWRHCQGFQKCLELIRKEGDLLIGMGVEIHRDDFASVSTLPPLVTEENVLTDWCDAFEAHVLRHYPDYTVIEHPDWKHLLTYKIKGKTGDWQWAFGKMLGETKRGFGRIAKRATPLKS